MQVPGVGAATGARGRVAEESRGRVNQKQRTRMAIVEATRKLARRGAEISMPAVAREALVSEATAYRYFPDLATLLREADDGRWPSPAEALKPVADSDDPVERVAFATEYLLRGVLNYQNAVRAMISASITKPPTAATRPGHRFGLIDYALAPLDRTLGQSRPGGAGAAPAGPGRGDERRGPVLPDGSMRPAARGRHRQRGADGPDRHPGGGGHGRGRAVRSGGRGPARARDPGR